jgi:hypothetical protein
VLRVGLRSRNKIVSLTSCKNTRCALPVYIFYYYLYENNVNYKKRHFVRQSSATMSQCILWLSAKLSHDPKMPTIHQATKPTSFTAPDIPWAYCAGIKKRITHGWPIRRVDVHCRTLPTLEDDAEDRDRSGRSSLRTRSGPTRRAASTLQIPMASTYVQLF